MKYAHGTEPLQCGGASEYDNGNGSLMRIGPLALYLYAKHGKKLTEEGMEEVHHVSCLTHAHPRSQMACGIYVAIAVGLLDGVNLSEAICAGLEQARSYYGAKKNFVEEIDTYSRLWNCEVLAELPETAIKSSGYVVDTMEAALWCLLKGNRYADCVLRAVNLGGDTDTVAAITGGLAGLAYGMDKIPKEWIDTLLRMKYIENLCKNFVNAI